MLPEALWMDFTTCQESMTYNLENIGIARWWAHKGVKETREYTEYDLLVCEKWEQYPKNNF